MPFQVDQPATVVHERLRRAVDAFKDAEHNVIVWFAEMKRRRLYRELGHGSMRQYAIQELGFSATRAADFGRLADCLESLPRIREKVASGELGYTKAREIVAVASPETEAAWLNAAESSSRRELEEKVRRVRRRAAARRRKTAAAVGQTELLPADDPAVETLAESVPSTVSLRMTAEQRARYDALWQKLGSAPNAEDLLQALANLAESLADATASAETSCADISPRGDKPPMQIVVLQCPECGAMETAGQPLDRVDAERVQCDATVGRPGHRNSTTIPPRVRREVLARDRSVCQAPGCHHRAFLEIHHLVPRARGGSNEPSNLVTLCSACHRLWHERGCPPGMPGSGGLEDAG